MATEQEFLELVHKKIAILGVQRAKALRLELVKYHLAKREGPVTLESVIEFTLSVMGTLSIGLELAQDEDAMKQITEEVMKELGEV